MIPPSRSESRFRVEPYLPFILCLVAALTYIAAVRFDFVYDDRQQIVNNGLIRSWRYVPLLFKTDVWRFLRPNGVSNYWRPVFMVWLLLNYKVFGLHPAGWHLAAVGLHVLATYLCYRVLKLLFGDSVLAFIAALVFAVHPVHIESVAWVSGATDSLMAIFVLLSLAGFVRGWRGNKPLGWYLLSAFLLACGLLSKEPAVTTPVFALLYALLFDPKRERPWWKRAMPFAWFGLVFVGYWMGRNFALAGVTHSHSFLSAWTLVLTWPSLLWFYLRHLLWPVGMSTYYGEVPVLQVSWSRFWWPLIADSIAAAVVVILARQSNWRRVLFAVAILLLPLAPAFYFPTLAPTDYPHDRYLYLSCLGFAMLVAMALETIGTKSRKGAFAAGIAIVLGFSVAVSAQMIYWSSDLLLFSRATQIAPYNLLSYNGLAGALARAGRNREAVVAFEQVLKLDPNNREALYNIGVYHFLQQDYSAAEPPLVRAVEFDGNDSESLVLLADTLNHEQRYREAEPLVRHAMELRPNDPNARRVLAETLAGEGKIAEAMQVGQAELEMHPDDLEAKELVEKLQSERGEGEAQKPSVRSGNGR